MNDNDVDKLARSALHKGDTKAFTDLYAARTETMLAHARVRLKNEADAENVVQEAWLRIIHAKSFNGTNFIGWSTAILRHAITNHAKDLSRRPSLNPDLSWLRDSTEGPLENVERKEQEEYEKRVLELLPGCVDELSIPQREAFILRYLDDASDIADSLRPLKEIAEILGKAQGTISGLLDRAERDIIRCLMARLGS